MKICYVKNNVASRWFELPEKQAEAVARKDFGCSFALWNHLKKTNQVQKRIQK